MSDGRNPPPAAGNMRLPAAIALLPGVALFAPWMVRRPGLSPAFPFWSFAIVLIYGLAHRIGARHDRATLNGGY